MKRLLCLLLLLFQLPLYAGQDRYEIETAYFHDVQQKHTLESAQAQAFKPYLGQLRLGFIDGETWIRIRLKYPQESASLVPASPLVLRVEPYSLSRLAFYQKTQAAGRNRWRASCSCKRKTFALSCSIVLNSVRRVPVRTWHI
jgi:hypothetical protein